MSRPRVIVVGGGIAGLTAALACADGGARVTVVEARLRLGGATWTAQRAGLSVDNGHLRRLDRLRVAAGALRLARLDPDRQDLDHQTLAGWLASRGQSASAVERFWNLIALPTLNVDAAEASLDLAVRTFRTGFFRDASAADIGYARVPLDQLHAEPAGRALVDAGAEVLLRRRVRGVDVDGGAVAGI